MSGYIGTQPVPQATQTRDSFTATSGQTSFATGGYTPNFLDVYLNGVKLAAADYTASNGSDVVLASGAATGDILEVVAFTTFNSASSSIDDNGNATALTITSDEQVLIGKTSTGLSVTGTQITSDGRLMVTRDGNQAADFNRKSSDGDIVKFQKDGSTVGSIGTYSGTLAISSANTGIMLDDTNNILRPTNASGGSRDGIISLGNPSQRFKDAYLSGGVYLGGTGSANKLDDYEEGTWTPTFSFTSGSVTYLVNHGFYTKVGRQVTINANVFIDTVSSASGDLQVSGLPFNLAINVGERAITSVTLGLVRALSSNFTSMKSYINSANKIVFTYNNTNQTYLPVDANVLNSGSGIYVTATYQTD